MTAKYSIVAFFCEDIRTENNGKEIMIGILPDNLRVSTIPGMMGKICMYVRCHFDPTFELKSLSISLKTPTDEILSESKVEEEVIEKGYAEAGTTNNLIVGIISRMTLAPFIIKTTGRYVATANVNGESIVCGAINFLEQSSANES